MCGFPSYAVSVFCLVFSSCLRLLFLALIPSFFLICWFFFFFSSRRRHTRYIGDWSSDVCSSDLVDSQLLRDGSPDEVAEATRRCLAEGNGQKHIVNLNHGVDRRTPVENVEAFVLAAKARTGR